MINWWNPDQQGIPGVINLIVSQLRAFRNPTDTLPEFRSSDQAFLKFVKQRIMTRMGKKPFYVFYAQLCKSMLSAFEVNQKDDIPVVKDDVFDVLHSRS